MTLRVLITGVSGVGKSTVIEALQTRWIRAVDVDAPPYSEEIAVDNGELTGLGSGRDWVWRIDLVREIVESGGDDVLIVSGCSPNQDELYDHFDHVVLLSAPPEVVEKRLTTRTNNPFGKRAGETERALAIQQEIEPLLREGADLEVDTTAPIEVVVSTILGAVGID